MSRELLDRSPDLQHLENDGYEVRVVGGCVVVGHVPYVTKDKEVRFGTLAADLTAAGDMAIKPASHVGFFAGDEPCDADGRPLTAVVIGSVDRQILEASERWWQFSSKPSPDGYPDYYELFTAYIAILAGHAQVIDSTATACTFRPVLGEPEDIFRFRNTAASRAGVEIASNALRLDAVAILGLGGTGGYILDFLAKTPIRSIHLWDGDAFLQHNAFRSPGAASVEQLHERPTKVRYLADQYNRMHRGIVAHPMPMTSETLSELNNMAFVFIAIDDSAAKAPILDHLEEQKIPFVDVGMGIEQTEEKALTGLVRTTLSTDRPGSRERARADISTSGNDDAGQYGTNIQIAELNAFNAALAVIQFKRTLGFYIDLDNHDSSTFALDSNRILNTGPTESSA